jgi:hypothetical protein
MNSCMAWIFPIKMWIVPRSNAKKCSLAKSTVENERKRTGGKDENLLNCTGLFGAGVAWLMR